MHLAPFYAGAMKVPALLHAVREATGLKQAELAKKIGVSQGTVSKWESEQVSPNKKQWDALLSFVRRSSRTQHLAREISTAQKVPLVGHVGAGAAVTIEGEGPGSLDEDIPAPEGSTEKTVAVEIRGDSLGSFFDQWLVFYDDVRSPVTNDLINKLCVCGLSDGRVLIKRIRRSKTRGLFHLESQAGDSIYDVSIDWAARVKTMTPR